MNKKIQAEIEKANEENKSLKWGLIQPLIGGVGIAGMRALGTEPEFIVSQDAMRGNQKHFLHNFPEFENRYFTAKELPDLEDIGEFNDLNDDIDIMIGVPVCSALSRLNTQASAEYKSVENVYDLARWTLGTIKPKAYIFENAPSLFTNFGKPVLDELNKIAEEFGYSSSVMYTDTQKHGVPQRRHRTFYVFWNTPTAPLMEYYDRELPELPEYLDEVPHWALYQNHDNIEDNDQLDFLIEEFGPDFRETVLENRETNITFYSFLGGFKGDIESEDSLFQKYYRFATKRENVRELKILDRIVYKRSMNKGIWDSSLLFCAKGTNACMAKTMSSTMHPSENRLINNREWMHLMGLPHDFELTEEKCIQAASQNVPVQTATDWIVEVAKGVRGMLPYSDFRNVKQHNIKQSHEDMGPKPDTATLV